MSTNHDRKPTEPSPTTGDARHWWPRLTARINTAWTRREDPETTLRAILAIPPRWATAGLLVGTAVAAVAALTLIWQIGRLVADIILGIVGGGATAAGHGGRRLAAWQVSRAITQPIHHYIQTHTAGLPVSTDLAWWIWLTTTGGLFALAVFGSRGARLGWTLTGAMTVAMVYAGTPATSRTVAAGLAVAAWSVLSIPALAGRRRPYDITVINSLPPTPAAKPDPPASDGPAAG